MLTVEFVADNIKLIFSMSNVNIIVDTIIIFAWFKSNKIDLLVTKEQIKGISPFDFGICRSVAQCRLRQVCAYV